MLNEIYKEYGPYFYVPMDQAYSVAVPVTIGCSWDKCLYCDLNQHNKFGFFGLKIIEEKLIMLKDYYSSKRNPVKKVVMAGGNPLCLDTKILIEVIELIKKYFPKTESIASFARADDILRKSKEELQILRELGMRELTIGIESGNDEVLAFHNKGVTVEDNFNALSILEQCDIAYSTYIMVGLGGRELSEKNAIDTGIFISKFNPRVIIVVTLVLFKNARLVEKLRSKEFIRLRPLEAIYEEKLLLEYLNVSNSIFNGSHKTNSLILKGKLPEHKELLLKRINKVLERYDGEDIKHNEMRKWQKWSVE